MVEIKGKSAQEIADCVRALVQAGELQPGATLPPVRELAETLAVNRNTVAAAYQRLAKAGIAQTQGRHGTTISAPPRAGEQEGLSQDTALIDLADGNPNPHWLPPVAALFSGVPARPYLYGDDTLLAELREFGERWLAPDCPAPCSLELTHGAVDAIERLVAAHLVPGDSVAIEDPSFLGTLNTLRLAGMRPLGVAMDRHGMLPEALRAALDQGVRAVLLTPRAQNPTGCSLTRSRAQQLRKVLAGYPNVLVVVDDHFGLLEETPYHSVIPPSTARWALLRSVSKGLGPDLRVAFVACDTLTAERLRTRLASGMSWVSHILQGLVLSGLGTPAARARMDQAREGYARLRRELCEELKRAGVEVSLPDGGFNVWIALPRDARDVAYALAKKGWLVRLGSAFDVDGQSSALRVTISHLQPGQARRFALDLGACL
ncbi:MAG: Vitamin B6 salvage pathway transcriptional repressor PtsJ [Pseudomonas citronellolis]|nr:MAG: Vitamin B6 salvage pathway transcriptional repressor PtsJ [Pseudomonas citronellolis]